MYSIETSYSVRVKWDMLLNICFYEREIVTILNYDDLIAWGITITLTGNQMYYEIHFHNENESHL